jgi:hypothetical protein
LTTGVLVAVFVAVVAVAFMLLLPRVVVCPPPVNRVMESVVVDTTVWFPLVMVAFERVVVTIVESPRVIVVLTSS